MNTFNTCLMASFGITLGLLLPLLLLGMVRIIYFTLHSLRLQLQIKQQEHNLDNILAGRWYLKESSQPPNKNMRTLRLKNLETKHEIEYSEERDVLINEAKLK